LSKGAQVLELLSRTYVQAGLSVLGLMVVLGLAYFVLSRLRDSSIQDRTEPGELLKNFEEMRQEGDIDEAEFRNIQTLLKNDSKRAS
jgi:uncharacterized membrane protein